MHSFNYFTIFAWIMMFNSLASAKGTFGIDNECFFQCREFINQSHASYSHCYIQCMIEKKERLASEDPEDSTVLNSWHSIPKIVGSPDEPQQLLGGENGGNKKKVDDLNNDAAAANDDDTTRTIAEPFIVGEQIDCDEKCGGIENTARSAYCYLKCVSENTRVPGWLDPWVVGPGHIAESKKKVSREFERPDDTMNNDAINSECTKTCEHLLGKSITRYYWCYLNCVNSKHYIWPYGAVRERTGVLVEDPTNHDVVLANFASGNNHKTGGRNEAYDGDAIVPIKMFSANNQIDCDEKCGGMIEPARSAYCYLKCVSENTRVPGWLDPWVVSPGHVAESKVLVEQQAPDNVFTSTSYSAYIECILSECGGFSNFQFLECVDTKCRLKTSTSSSASSSSSSLEQKSNLRISA